MTEIEMTTQEETKKTTPNHIFLFSLLAAVIIILGVAVIKYYSIRPEVRALHFLQWQAVLIQKNQAALEEMQSCKDCNKDITTTRKKILNEDIKKFNKKIDEAMKIREIYPVNEPIPKKFNISKIVEKEAP